jgi:hypothetical protein
MGAIYLFPFEIITILKVPKVTSVILAKKISRGNRIRFNVPLEVIVEIMAFNFVDYPNKANRKLKK